jgi:hypothetical protein
VILVRVLPNFIRVLLKKVWGDSFFLFLSPGVVWFSVGRDLWSSPPWVIMPGILVSEV